MLLSPGPSGRRLAASAPGSAVNGTFSPPPSTPSTISGHTPLLGSARPRTPKRPGTSSVPVTASSIGPGTSGLASGSPFQEPESPLARRAFTLGAGASGGRKIIVHRKPSLGDLPSASSQQPQSLFKGLRRRAISSSSLRTRDGLGGALVIGTGSRSYNTTTSSNTQQQHATVAKKGSPPDFALPLAAKQTRDTAVSPESRTSGANPNTMDIQGGGRMLSRTGTASTVNGYGSGAGGGLMLPPPSAGILQGEASMVHQHIQEMANKRISTLEYLRKAHEGRVYWFNTLLFDKPDLARMPYFDSRRLARRATNYLLLGLSLPTVIDLNSSTPIEFLRSFNLLLTEFDSFQSLHPETGGPASSGLGRARIPNLNVFRRATPSSKSRRSSSANNEILYEDGGSVGTNGGGISGASTSLGTPSSMSVMNGLGGSASVVSFGQSEADLLPGEEYVHLLTPSLPFDPDFFETFATLCDVLIDAYTRLLSLLPTPRECNAAVAEMFTKADSRVRKIIVQGIVKEFEDTSRNGVKSEVANVGKIVLGGLM